jgi:hypothetical protein
MALGSTQSLAEMSTRTLLGDKMLPGRKADDLIAICEPIALKMWKPRRLITLWASTAVTGIALSFMHKLFTHCNFSS